MDKLFYLASPFTHSDILIMRSRTEVAIQASIDLLNLGVVVFSPIAYNGSWIDRNIPGDWQFWEKYDKLFIRRTDGIIVLQVDGWDRSVGVSAEIVYAKELGKPVYYITPEEIKNGDVSKLR